MNSADESAIVAKCVTPNPEEGYILRCKAAFNSNTEVLAFKPLKAGNLKDLIDIKPSDISLETKKDTLTLPLSGFFGKEEMNTTAYWIVVFCTKIGEWHNFSSWNISDLAKAGIKKERQESIREGIFTGLECLFWYGWLVLNEHDQFEVTRAFVQRCLEGPIKRK